MTLITSTLYKIFHGVCIIMTIGLQIHCIYIFLLNEDVSIVQYQPFHAQKGNIYPSITLCIVNPFLEDELKKYGDGINTTSYSNFLAGEHWDERMLKIRYEGVTVSSKEAIPLNWIWLPNEVYLPNSSQAYTSFRSSHQKCITFDIPFIDKTQVNVFGIQIQKSIFPRGQIPEKSNYDNWNLDRFGGLETYFHYPKQFLNSFGTRNSEWNSVSNNTKQPGLGLNLEDVKVIRNRYKYNKPCIAKERNYDELFMEQRMLDTGCRPPHWNSTSKHLKLCSSPNQMKRFTQWSLMVINARPEILPCSFIQDLSVTYFDDAWNKVEGKMIFFFYIVPAHIQFFEY